MLVNSCKFMEQVFGAVVKTFSWNAHIRLKRWAQVQAPALTAASCECTPQLKQQGVE